MQTGLIWFYLCRDKTVADLKLWCYPLCQSQILFHQNIQRQAASFCSCVIIFSAQRVPPASDIRHSCSYGYRGEGALAVIDVKSILSVVAMAPFSFLIDGPDDQHFMIEKAGLDVTEVDSLEDEE